MRSVGRTKRERIMNEVTKLGLCLLAATVLAACVSNKKYMVDSHRDATREIEQGIHGYTGAVEDVEGEVAFRYDEESGTIYETYDLVRNRLEGASTNIAVRKTLDSLTIRRVDDGALAVEQERIKRSSDHTSNGTNYLVWNVWLPVGAKLESKIADNGESLSRSFVPPLGVAATSGPDEKGIGFQRAFSQSHVVEWPDSPISQGDTAIEVNITHHLKNHEVVSEDRRGYRLKGKVPCEFGECFLLVVDDHAKEVSGRIEMGWTLKGHIVASASPARIVKTFSVLERRTKAESGHMIYYTRVKKMEHKNFNAGVYGK